jgi:CheY-like chemotaxis protein
MTDCCDGCIALPVVQREGRFFCVFVWAAARTTGLRNRVLFVALRMESILTVLVAEDNPDDAFLLQRAFKEVGLNRPIHVVHDGADAISYLHGDPPFGDRRLHPFPDIVILDLKMPRVSGFEVLQWINKNPDYRVIPAIVWSSSADRRDVKHAFCLGAHAYLCKPGSYDRFVERVRDLVGFWRHCEKPGITPQDPSCESMKDRDPFFGAHFR